jgi:hypothetical protein
VLVRMKIDSESCIDDFGVFVFACQSGKRVKCGKVGTVDDGRNFCNVAAN